MYRLGTRKQNNGAGRADCNFCRLSPYSLLTHPNPTRSGDAHKKKKKKIFWKKLNVIPETSIQRSSLPSPADPLIAVFEKSVRVVYVGETPYYYRFGWGMGYPVQDLDHCFTGEHYRYRARGDLNLLGSGPELELWQAKNDAVRLHGLHIGAPLVPLGPTARCWG